MNRRPTGQMLLIAVLILAVLAITIPAIVMINKTLLQHGALIAEKFERPRSG